MGIQRLSEESIMSGILCVTGGGKVKSALCEIKGMDRSACPATSRRIELQLAAAAGA